HARISRHSTRECTVEQDDNRRSRREMSFEYSFVDSTGTAEQVCKIFFLSTLGYKPTNDSAITSLMKSAPLSAISASCDKRGRHPPSNKMDEQLIRAHILSHHPQVSHYRREHAP